MAVLINLLPDIKLERLRYERRKRRMFAIGLSIMAAGVGLPIILGVVMAGQQVMLNNTRNANQEGIQQLRSVENINEIITAKNQLEAIYALRDDGQDMLGFLEVLESSLPKSANITSISINDLGELELSGEAADLEQVDLTIKALSNFTPQGLVTNIFEVSSTPYIQNIKVESVEPGLNGVASFTITGQFNFAILAEAKLNEANIESAELSGQTPEASNGESPPNPFIDQNQSTGGAQ